jgi:predicted amidohydrolase YtcJ
VKSAAFDRLILHGARIRTLDALGTRAEAIGFSAGRVTAVGSLEEVRRATPDADERELGGRVVYPGFIDAHHHFCFSATWGDLPVLRSHRSIAQILASVAAQAASIPPGEWVVLVGWDETGLAEQRGPTRFELDEVAPAHPVLLIHFSYHQGVLNSLGLERAGLQGRSPDPAGGLRGRTRTGELDGNVFERCFGHAEDIARRAFGARDREAWFATANRYQDRVLAAGITHVCDAAVPPEMEALYRDWQARGELHVGVTMMPLVGNMFAVPAERLDGARTGWREGRLSVGPMKLFLDGGRLCAVCFSLRDAILQLASMLRGMLRGRVALPWLFSPGTLLRLGADLRLHTGLLFYQSGALEALLASASARGFGIGMHAAGNEAIEQAIRAFARSYRGPLPPRIDHFFLTTERSLRAAAREGIHAVVQPPLALEQGDMIRAVGTPPHLEYAAFGRMRSAGVRLAGSSDAPCGEFDVIASLDFAVRRALPSGASLFAEQALSAPEAVDLYTRGAAAVLGMEGEIGQLVPGARADAVVLSADPLEVPAERLREISVIATFAGRRELWPGTG